MSSIQGRGLEACVHSALGVSEGTQVLEVLTNVLQPDSGLLELTPQTSVCTLSTIRPWSR